MASAPYVDEYLDSLGNLPVELKRNFALMRELGGRSQEEMRYIDKLSNDFLSNIDIYHGSKKIEKMNKIQRKFNKAKEYADDKVQLANQTYELVDEYIQKLDSELTRFEEEMQDRASSTSRYEEESLPKCGRKNNDKEINYTTSEENTYKTSKKKQIRKVFAKTSGTSGGWLPVKIKTSSVSAVSNPINPTNSVASVVVETRTDVGAGVVQSPEVIDMPVDPNEPTYCLCTQVSYAKMIGCDNPDCPVEWFHFTCVKLIIKPKGKWFCPICLKNKKKK
ncbi:inhibitor of growth protein 5-like [Aphis gossypii]|uniref:inhibitor of growth protein 5-like n=1 Tax=Aphis gossypii TaxID=80765 RepID=UPI002158F598|nr:inhibitor of growth protein 5-like [Aphis gossypii]